MGEIAIDLMNKPPCDCDQKFIEELGVGGHFASCSWRRSLTQEESALMNPVRIQEEEDAQRGMDLFVAQQLQHGRQI